jgi:unspecific peroxygenase
MILSSVLSFSLAAMAVAFPAHQSLAGLSREELEAVLPMLKHRSPESLPGPLNDTSTKLVNDAAHPWQPLRPGDIRGPCPGLNTLASHGVNTSNSENFLAYN